MAEHLHEFLVEQIALGDCQYAVFVEHLRIELAELVEQDVVFLIDIIGIAGYHKEQQGIALNMAEEAQAEALTFGSTFNDAGDISHHERFVVVIAHDAERGFHGGEGIVGYLWSGIAER